MLGAMDVSLRWVAALALLGTVACSEDTGDGDAGIMEDAGPGPVWVREEVPTDADMLAIWGRSATEVYAVGWDGTVVRYDGLTWSLETTSATVPLTGVHGIPTDPEDPMAPPGPLFAVGWDGVLLTRNPDGSWVNAAPTSTATEDFFGVAVGDDDSALVVGDEGRLLTWDGTIWSLTRLRVPGEFSGELLEPKGVLKSAWTGNGNRYYIVGSGGAAYRSNNGVASFEAIDTRISAPLRGLWGTGNNNVYAVGLDGLILRYNNGWRIVRNDGAEELPAIFFFGISGINNDDITVAGWRGVVARRLGGAWFVEQTDIEEDLRGVWVDPETQIAFAVGASGTIIRRDPPPPPDPNEMN